ncbi:hypothetical protein E2986_10664 [Frieseomelitta varia]|uniref:Uncharacterized protein n=1 Tax=Frieseomelitta varia TaxID=561572 RepID=A0A833RV99_9HYME|nr:hypothetical protein E2986_10664 [Frieseomelitta varia]
MTFLSRLTSGNNMPLKLIDEGSWLVSLTIIGSTIGSFMGASFADRKLCLWIFHPELVFRSDSKRSPVRFSRDFRHRLYNKSDIPLRSSRYGNPTLGTLTVVNVFTGLLFTAA